MLFVKGNGWDDSTVALPKWNDRVEGIQRNVFVVGSM